MDPRCRNISRLILPAMRASLAEIMKSEYNYRQREIAERLGVVQVSISKYLNKKYSSDIERIKIYINEKGLNRKIIEDIVKGKSPAEIGREMDDLCGTLALELK
jgi:predicted transcriptional regulator